jgi:hypothetical protein
MDTACNQLRIPSIVYHGAVHVRDVAAEQFHLCRRRQTRTGGFAVTITMLRHEFAQRRHISTHCCIAWSSGPML